MYNPHLHFHFAGIGGAGMSGIAEILLSLGFAVSGSDVAYSETCRRLERLGAKVSTGHCAEHVPEGASLVVYSSALRSDNPEIAEANRRGIPVIRRAEVLAELMRLKFGVAVAGSHGKTTTTSLIATVLEQGGLDPTVIIGGQVKSRGSGSRVGKSPYLVAESDESDRSFLLLKPTVAVVTNIDAEHLSAYESLSELEQSFESFARSVPFYGLAVLCIDDRRVRDLASRYAGRKRTYGFSPDAELRAQSIVPSPAGCQFELWRQSTMAARVSLPMLGRHFVQNALAAVAVGLEFEIPLQDIVRALESFSGVSRRVETVGQAHGVVVINDYGHHPTEIRATLRAVRESYGEADRRIWTVFQPHRYTRTRECFAEFVESFGDADDLVVTEIYSAGEPPLTGISGRILFEALAHPRKEFVADVGRVSEKLIDRLAPGDIVVCLGAGSIGSLADKLVAQLQEKEHVSETEEIRSIGNI